MDGLAKFIGYAVLAAVVFVVIVVGIDALDSSPTALDSSPNCVAESVGTPQEEIYIVKENPDYGYYFISTVRNDGKRGNITTLSRLSTSEGDFVRKRTLLFEAGERLTIRADFPEPTINATDVTVYVQCSE